jgi:hypothetical protein
MDNLILKIKQREEIKRDNYIPPRVCVDYRYLRNQEEEETSSELKKAKTKA